MRRKLANASIGSAHATSHRASAFRVLERLAGALAGTGHHRVRQVPDELDPPTDPSSPVIGRVNSPHFEHSVMRPRSLASRGSGLEGKLARISSIIAAGRPAFLDPCVRILLRDHVHELAATDVVGDEVTPFSNPLRYGREAQEAHPEARLLPSEVHARPSDRYMSVCRRHRAPDAPPSARHRRR